MRLRAACCRRPLLSFQVQKGLVVAQIVECRFAQCLLGVALDQGEQIRLRLAFQGLDLLFQCGLARAGAK